MIRRLVQGIQGIQGVPGPAGVSMVTFAGSISPPDLFETLPHTIPSAVPGTNPHNQRRTL